MTRPSLPTSEGAGWTVVEPSTGWRGLGLGEVWHARELLFFLIWRDVKVRFQQTLFGVGWAVLQPVLLMVVFSLSIGRLAGLSQAGIPYPLFVLSGLVPWTLFAQSIGGAANSLVASESVLTKVYFPRLLLPLSAVLSHVSDFLLALVVLVVFALASGATLTASILLVPLALAITLATTVGAGTLLAAINVRYRDVRQALPFLVQVWFFATPVIYSVGLIPNDVRFLLYVNPLAGAVTIFQWAFAGTSAAWDVIVASIAVAIVLLVLGSAYFRRAEPGFADVI